MFRYSSLIGEMIIFLDQATGSYALQIGDIIYGHYQNAIAAADDVYTHVTGCYEWDSLDGKIPNVPTDIYEWSRG